MADLLGHTSVDMTRIYTIRSGIEQQRQTEHLPLPCLYAKRKDHIICIMW